MQPFNNYQDIEFVVDDASSLVRPGCTATFSETELGGGLEVMVLFALVACILAVHSRHVLLVVSPPNRDIQARLFCLPRHLELGG